ncbi:hypothetical protein [Chamaesiphon sp. VAR_48_metabat_403]|uniref:hypothetical protein n=1 Tax=Chamaesiphon sp. VAR_48_metabat_403 TaxID=2964700 RepID=UPI00286D9163|nr:hypothetical protein [Chamaesiphon sp. VAR_48_metabat_403]
MNLFADVPENGKTDLPYRARYKVLFDGSQSELKSILLKFLSELNAQYLDSDEDDSHFRWNPIEDQWELSAILQEDLELSLSIYWSSINNSPVEVTFDLDSPTPIEIPIEGLFFEPAKTVFPSIRLVYNFLYRSKITTTKPREISDFPANRQWLKDHRLQYRGKWVALQEGHLLAEAPSANELLQKLDSIQHVLLTAVY